ncbi:MAG TPA: hypothetical protein VF734_18765 [Pseudonocardiaceae bacterium]
MSGRRARGEEYAARVNAAAALVAAGVAVVDATGQLAARFGCSQRQARRYVERAAGGPVEVPVPTTVFTVKLPVGLAVRVREHAAGSGRTISSVVAQALEEFLSRGRKGHPRR